MNLKFHVQHDQTAGLQTSKSQPGREFKMAIDTKNSKTIKINFFSRIAWCMAEITGTLIFSDIERKKKSVVELGLIDSLEIHVDPSKIYVDPGF